MSELENKIKDTYWEHEQHDSYDKNCSECFKIKKNIIEKAERNGLAYSGDNEFGEPEFIGTIQDWNKYDNDIVDITEGEYKANYDYDKDDKDYHESKEN